METKQNPVPVNPDTNIESQIREQIMIECSKVADLLLAKQASYGYKNLVEFGEIGILVRGFDKISRLRNLIWLRRDNTIADESVDDTWMDLAGYAIMRAALHNLGLI